MLHKFASFLDSNRDGCGNCTINWKTAYHYVLLDTPTGFFGQVVSTLGDFLGHIRLLLSLKLFNQYACFEFSKFILGSESICKRTLHSSSCSESERKAKVSMNWFSLNVNVLSFVLYPSALVLRVNFNDTKQACFVLFVRYFAHFIRICWKS